MSSGSPPAVDEALYGEPEPPRALVKPSFAPPPLNRGGMLFGPCSEHQFAVARDTPVWNVPQTAADSKSQPPIGILTP